MISEKNPQCEQRCRHPGSPGEKTQPKNQPEKLYVQISVNQRGNLRRASTGNTDDARKVDKSTRRTKKTYALAGCKGFERIEIIR